MGTNACRTIVTKLVNRRTFSDTNRITTAGIIIIGDEILKGTITDTNSAFLAMELHCLGVDLKKISVIGDTIPEVSDEVKEFSKRYSAVITSGGIGPTHDDITYEAVAKAFNEPLILHPELKQLCTKYYNTTDEKHPGMKLALVPKSCKLSYIPKPEGLKMNYPNVSIKNVYMFPGIPELLRKSFSNLGKDIFKSTRKFYFRSVHFNITEDKIVGVLNVLVEEFPDVQFGSYPKLFDAEYKVKITIESSEESRTMEAHKKLLQLIPSEHIVLVKENGKN